MLRNLKIIFMNEGRYERALGVCNKICMLGPELHEEVRDRGRVYEALDCFSLALADYRINMPAHLQPDDVFADIIRHFNIRATDQLLDDPELRQLMLPVVRAEFQMVGEYKFVAETPWEIPITCFANRGDPYVSREHALGWGRFTNARLQVHIRRADHFSIVDDAAFILAEIDRELRAAV